MIKLNAQNEVGLQDKIKDLKPLKVKLGFDPTSPDLHLGHYVVLKGARKFQEAGHKVCIIIGDFTASIGDPSGRNKLRPPLSEDDIVKNAKTYMEQVFLVLDQDKTEVVRNSQWLNKMTVKDTIALMSFATVSQILVREDFKNRFDSQIPIFMHEMMYPLMQAMDSVQINADVELGGTDQTFNLMMGRELQRHFKKSEQAVVTFPLLVGLDGEKKMSKSLKNHIGLLDSPEDKFGKIMSISDNTMWNYWSVLCDKSDKEIAAMKESGVNPRDIKLDLAVDIVKVFHGQDIALEQKNAFLNRFSKKNLSENIAEVEVVIENESIKLSEIIKNLKMADSISDANRKIEQNGVRINQEKMADKNFKLKKGEDVLLQVGKIHVKKVKIR